MEATKVTLYSYFRSSCSWRIRIALGLKKVNYNVKTINLLKDGGEQYDLSYGNINPMQQIPSFVIDDKILTQSMSILEFIEEKWPQPNLLPNEIFLRAKVREICEIINSGIQPLQNLSVLKSLDEDKQITWAQKWIRKGFIALEKILEKSAKTYCVGDDLTLADCCLVPQVFNAKRFQVNVDQFPIIKKINSNLELLEAFQQAHPSKQPDCPEELK